MKPALLQWAETRRYRVAWAPIGILAAVREDLERRLASGAVDAVFAEQNLGFEFGQAETRDSSWRVVLVLMPRPAHLVGFVLGGRRLDAIVPPTYQRYRQTFDEVRRELEGGALKGARVEQLHVPLKLLAARLDLVRYGRNNLAYAPPFGSYMQILGYATDADLPVAPGWQPAEPSLLEQCERCRACEVLCPTGAIRCSRVLIGAERCLTLVNEAPGPWPRWVPPAAHHCLIGCLRCQRSCPANGDLPLVPSGVVFTEEETLELLEEGGEPSGHAREKLRAIVGPREAEVIGRNLRALLEADGRWEPSAACGRAVPTLGTASEHEGPIARLSEFALSAG
jgi:epoxyqueuosine reductase